jgi:hypothetical protein
MQVTVAGAVQLLVTLDGVAVRGSPFVGVLAPAPTDAARCTLHGRTATRGVRGFAAEVLLTPRDRFGNARPVGADAFVAELTDSAGERSSLVRASCKRPPFQVCVLSLSKCAESSHALLTPGLCRQPGGDFR